MPKAVIDRFRGRDGGVRRADPKREFVADEGGAEIRCRAADLAIDESFAGPPLWPPPVAVVFTQRAIVKSSWIETGICT